MSRTVVGCDPGFAGAICILTSGAPRITRMPLLRQRKHAYDVSEIAKILLGRNQVPVYGPDIVYGDALLVIEQVTRPASLTRCMGLLEGLGEALGYEVVTVRPQEWKRYFHLGPVKADSIALALKKWPSLAKTITKAGDDGLAEAALIAQWGRENCA